MALNYLKLNGVDYFTIKGSVTESRGGGMAWVGPRRWSLTVDVYEVEQEDNLLYCFNGIPVPVTMPDGESVPQVIVMAQSMPAVISNPRRNPVQVDIEIEEKLS